jgi:cytochrome b6-f complex iron-sulfur subunit
MNGPETPRRQTRLLRLFPRAWRARYAAEFMAVLAESPLGARDYVDIVVSALDARLRPQAWALQMQAEGARPGGSVVRPVVSRPVGPSGTHPIMSRRFSRRTFLRNAVLGGTGIATAGTLAGSVVFAWPNKTSPFGAEMALPRTLVPPIGAPPYKHIAGKFWLINNADGLLALYWKCPHLGCTVPWEPNEGQFHCPCHQSQYNRFGELVAGPAPRPMDLMAVRVDPAGNILVHTGQITKRERYEPSQAVKI